jgi:transcription elongation factor Elf1
MCNTGFRANAKTISRYNSTKTTSCHMIFTPLVDMNININVSKCQSCGHSIRGEKKDLVDNILSAQKPERTDL